MRRNPIVPVRAHGFVHRSFFVHTSDTSDRIVEPVLGLAGRAGNRVGAPVIHRHELAIFDPEWRRFHNAAPPEHRDDSAGSKRRLIDVGRIVLLSKLQGHLATQDSIADLVDGTEQGHGLRAGGTRQEQ